MTRDIPFGWAVGITLAAILAFAIGVAGAANILPSLGSGDSIADPVSSTAWGDITGTLSAQTDLQSALDAKMASTDINTCAKLYAILGASEITGTCGDLVASVSPTFTGTPVLPSTITLGANSFIRAGAHGLTLTTSGTTDVTFPTSGTLLSTAAAVTVAQGGTGAATLTGLLQGNGTSAFTAITGTLGQMLYFNGTNTGAATSSLFIGSTNSRIGVSSTTPQRTLSVVGSVAVQEATLTDGATVTWDLSASSYARVNLTASRTLDITNAEQAIGQSVRLVVCANGAWSFTWDALIMWPGGTAPTQTATANKCDVYSGFVTNGTSTPKIFLGSVLAF